MHHRQVSAPYTHSLVLTLAVIYWVLKQVCICFYRLARGLSWTRLQQVMFVKYLHSPPWPFVHQHYVNTVINIQLHLTHFTCTARLSNCRAQYDSIPKPVGCSQDGRLQPTPTPSTPPPQSLQRFGNGGCLFDIPSVGGTLTSRP